MKVTITLTKSLIGRKENQILTCRSLELRKIGDRKTVERTPEIDGKLAVISHLVRVDEA